MTVRIGALLPNYLTVDHVTGQVGADFTGVINAFGITLPADDPSNINENGIQWVEQSDGSQVALVHANAYGDIHFTGRELLLQAFPDVAGGDTESKVVAEAFDAANLPHGVTVIDSNSSSNFLQLLNVGQVAVAYGSVTVTWAGASALSNLVTVNHNIGRVPIVVASPDTMSDASGPGYTRTSVITATQVSLQAKADHTPANGTTELIRWIAIG